MKKIFFIFVCILCAFSSGCFADTSKSKPDWKKDRFFHEEFFQRDYTLEHLAQNPSQRVKKIIIIPGVMHSLIQNLGSKLC